MATTYLKCHHGIELRSLGGCKDCDKEKQDMYKGLAYNLENREKDKRIPIYRGCGVGDDGQCFCTGRCKEVIGYID